MVQIWVLGRGQAVASVPHGMPSRRWSLSLFTAWHRLLLVVSDLTVLVVVRGWGSFPPQGVLSEVEAKQDDAGDGDVEMASLPASGPVADEAADSRTKVAAKVRG